MIKKQKSKKTLEQREKETQQKIQTLQTQLKTLQGNLDVFGVKKEIKVIDDKNYQNIIAELQKEIQDFEKILTEKKENIDQFILNYQYLLDIGKNLPLEEEKRFLDEYEKMNTDQMFENFNLFRESFSQLQEKLKFQISQENPFAAKGFSDPEFFNYKIFEPAEFVKIFDEKKLPDTEPINIDSEITGDKLADKRIFDIAQKRGYQKRNLATQESLISFGDQQIHQKVVEKF
ncbi:MAG: hypothetical protein HC932_02815 [Thermales bacterium]|nr:hypothetical protein [Thermales bacterium]